MGHLVLTDENFKNEVLDFKGLVLVDFWAVWCYPCQMLGPVIEEIATEFEGKLKVGKVDVDSAPTTSSTYGIQSIPTVMLFKDGKIVDTLIGVQPKNTYIEAIKRNS